MLPLKVIAEPRRARILELVWSRELSAGEIASYFDISWPAVSQHLGVLKDAGWLTERRDGKRRVYRARPEAMGPLRAIVEQQWLVGLHTLKALAEAEEGNSK